MERLTFDGNFCDISQCRELPCPHGGSCTQRKVWEKLKAYEDLGFAPEEVNDAVVGAKLMAKAKVVSAFGVPAERLRELAEADKAGRVVVLPCKVGDKLYRVFAGEIFEHRVGSMKYFAIQGRWDIETYPFCPCVESSIGKTIFSTREDAKKALEAMKDE